MKARTGCKPEGAKRTAMIQRGRVAGALVMGANAPAAVWQRIAVVNGLAGSVSAEDVVCWEVRIKRL